MGKIIPPKAKWNDFGYSEQYKKKSGSRTSKEKKVSKILSLVFL